MAIQPLRDQIVVRPIKEEEITPGGIILPDTIKDKPTKGLVIAVGPGTKDVVMQAKVGDTVLYNRNGAKELDYDGETLIYFRHQDILRIL